MPLKKSLTVLNSPVRPKESEKKQGKKKPRNRNMIKSQLDIRVSSAYEDLMMTKKWKLHKVKHVSSNLRKKSTSR